MENSYGLSQTTIFIAKEITHLRKYSHTTTADAKKVIRTLAAELDSVGAKHPDFRDKSFAVLVNEAVAEGDAAFAKL
jgi:hypothetical protein